MLRKNKENAKGEHKKKGKKREENAIGDNSEYIVKTVYQNVK